MRVPSKRALVRGWCPSAWRPMMAGDGLILRVKPHLSRLKRQQVDLLCDLAARFGNGTLELTNRANVQIRGVREEGRAALLEGLLEAGLVDGDPVRELRRNLLVAPDWTAGDDTCLIATELAERLDELPDLPGKIGFAIDAGTAPRLIGLSGDFRIERAVEGGLVLRLDGRKSGVAITRGDAVDGIVELARWFVRTGGTGRVAAHLADMPDWAVGDCLPAPCPMPPEPGTHALGQVLGIPFGSIEAAALAAVMEAGGAAALRVTPWRSVVLEGAAPVAARGFITEAGDPLLKVDACPGAPACLQSSIETRALARRLSGRVPGRLHVSGCSKGCARAAPADVVVTGRDGRFDLGRDTCAGGPVFRAGLTLSQLLGHFGAE